MKTTQEVLKYIDAYIDGHSKIMKTLVDANMFEECKHIQHTLELLKNIKQYAESEPAGVIASENYTIPENASVSTIKESPESLNKEGVIKESHPTEYVIEVCEGCDQTEMVNPHKKLNGQFCYGDNIRYIPFTYYQHLQAQNRKLREALEKIYILIEKKQDEDLYMTEQSMSVSRRLAKSALEESK